MINFYHHFAYVLYRFTAGSTKILRDIIAIKNVEFCAFYHVSGKSTQIFRNMPGAKHPTSVAEWEGLRGPVPSPQTY